jgi:hypothetical protein
MEYLIKLFKILWKFRNLQNSHQEINKENIRALIFSIKCHKVFMTCTLGRQIKSKQYKYISNFR